ncbi:hypothetical protein EXIGLDRAFT_328127 [Exidia glandulosa HHB12029]|uniref:Uncharacterized protein n=1 Tax=Exidia glandulosa HHB12029 TaxID=1314781 RepID=A0A165LPH3_EXIGL|nr:hypothetical protein EXIGLDRAFT_328127 [Exidia glandulosa HHB12029]
MKTPEPKEQPNADLQTRTRRRPLNISVIVPCRRVVLRYGRREPTLRNDDMNTTAFAKATRPLALAPLVRSRTFWFRTANICRRRVHATRPSSIPGSPRSADASSFPFALSRKRVPRQRKSAFFGGTTRATTTQSRNTRSILVKVLARTL